jgi:hypothetical protein
MKFKLETPVCEFCGIIRKLHNDIQKEKCSKARKISHENDERNKKRKRKFDIKRIDYFVKLK